jgi:hypothetical protein
VTIYRCDTCDGETPASAVGSSFLVLPDGKTDHFCSQACLRAHVNRGAEYAPLIDFLSIGLFLGACIEYVVHRILFQ